jgi:hypothetical protein
MCENKKNAFCVSKKIKKREQGEDRTRGVLSKKKIILIVESSLGAGCFQE